MEINIKKEIDELLEATVTNNMTEITKQKQIINAFFRIIQIDAIEGTNTKNKGYDVILIDDYMFKVLSWFVYEPTLHNYPILNIKSINIINQEITYFSVYTSNSEVGILRLVAASMLGPNADFFYKGKSDYVQQTMINLNLQIFIYKNFIIEYKKDNYQYYIDNLAINFNPSDGSLTLEQIKLTKDHIDEKLRQIEIEPFHTFNQDIRNSCLRPDKKTDRPDLSEITDKLKILSASLEKKFNITKRNYIGDINISNRNKSLSLNNFNFRDSPILMINDIIFDNGMILYYCLFKIGSDEYFSPITLITKDAKITKYGTYSQFIPAGYYICKPYDYTNQATQSERDMNIHPLGTYTFIANRYNNIYPYTMHHHI